MRAALLALELALVLAFWACGEGATPAVDDGAVSAADEFASAGPGASRVRGPGGAGSARSVADGAAVPHGIVPGPGELPGFVGRGACAPCHEAQLTLFSGSHHDLAMEPANEHTVLGDFDDASLTHFGTTSRFFRRDGGFWVRTDGPDGQLHDYPVAYTFGVFPLQQYLLPFPGGRLQVLPLCWDSRPVEAGGQRWFHIHPDEQIPAGDVLHWTGPNQNWNYQCAECHSTGLVKNYREASDDYATSWTEIDVSCEACHGPGQGHLEWAREQGSAASDRPRAPGDIFGEDDHQSLREQVGTERGDTAPDALDKGLVVSLRDANRGLWEFRDDTGIASRSAPRSSRAQEETCARCHARRSLIRARHAFGRPLLDNQRPSLLEAGLYHADGQPQDEVYVLGSFLQSPMHQAGVSCSDCHDPHALTVRGESNTVCAGCHAPERFDSSEHHHHQPGSAGAACVACHMPSTTFMVIDERREHRFAVPRPDLAEELGTPDACTRCHGERTASWAAQAALQWWGDGRRRRGHFSRALAAGRRGAVGAARRLVTLVADGEAAPIVRASALVLLGELPGGATLEVLAAAAAGEPLLRLAAARAGDALPPAARWEALGALLDDELLAVRAEAARSLAGAPTEGLDPASRAQLEAILASGPARAREPALESALESGLEEYRQLQHLDAERPEAQLNLGLLAARLGDLRGAEQAYRRGLELGPDFQPLSINLADLCRGLGRDAEGLAVLQTALARDPASPALHHARGLALIRLGRHGEALSDLESAALGDPDSSRFSYVWAVALASAGQRDRAIEVLERCAAAHPADRDVLFALSSYQAQAGDLPLARATARRLLALDPDDEQALALWAQFQGDPASSSADGGPGGGS